MTDIKLGSKSLTEIVADERIEAQQLLEKIIGNYHAQMTSNLHSKETLSGETLFKSSENSLVIQTYHSEECMVKDPYPIGCKFSVALSVLSNLPWYQSSITKTVNNKQSFMDGVTVELRAKKPNSYSDKPKYFELLISLPAISITARQEKKKLDTDAFLTKFFDDICDKLSDPTNVMTQKFTADLTNQQ